MAWGQQPSVTSYITPICYLPISHNTPCIVHFVKGTGGRRYIMGDLNMANKPSRLLVKDDIGTVKVASKELFFCARLTF